MPHACINVNTEYNVAYKGITVRSNLSKSQSDVESCRSSCRSMGIKYFSFWPTSTYSGHWVTACECKIANDDRLERQGVISGNTSACVSKCGQKDGAKKTINFVNVP